MKLGSEVSSAVFIKMVKLKIVKLHLQINSLNNVYRRLSERLWFLK